MPKTLHFFCKKMVKKKNSFHVNIYKKIKGLYFIWSYNMS